MLGAGSTAPGCVGLTGAIVLARRSANIGRTADFLRVSGGGREVGGGGSAVIPRSRLRIARVDSVPPA